MDCYGKFLLNIFFLLFIFGQLIYLLNIYHANLWPYFFSFEIGFAISNPNITTVWLRFLILNTTVATLRKRNLNLWSYIARNHWVQNYYFSRFLKFYMHYFEFSWQIFGIFEDLVGFSSFFMVLWGFFNNFLQVFYDGVIYCNLAVI
jgi:hypothetical protein